MAGLFPSLGWLTQRSGLYCSAVTVQYLVYLPFGNFPFTFRCFSLPCCWEVCENSSLSMILSSLQLEGFCLIQDFCNLQYDEDNIFPFRAEMREAELFIIHVWIWTIPVKIPYVNCLIIHPYTVKKIAFNQGWIHEGGSRGTFLSSLPLFSVKMVT